MTMACSHFAQHGGNVWEAARQQGLSPEEIIDFSANINPMGPPPRVLAHLGENLEQVRYYPEPQGEGLRKALADYYHLAPQQVMVGNGAAELIYLLCQTLRPSNALLPAPTFSEYARALEAAGGTVEYCPLVEETGFALPEEMLKARLETGRYQILFLCNPNNPTGNLYPPQLMADLLDTAAKTDTLLIMDESFLGLVQGGQEWSMISCFHRKAPENLFILTSFTKLYALPGLRLGVGLGPEALIERLQGARDPWTVNVLAQQAGRLCLEEETYRRETVELIAREREFLTRELARIPGLKVYPGAANYLLLHLRETGTTAAQARFHAAQKGICLRDASNFPFLDQYHLRVAVRLRQENQYLVEVLGLILNG